MVTVIGGSAVLVATRTEMERVFGQLKAVDQWLDGALAPQEFLIDPLARVGLALEAPLIKERLNQVAQGIHQAAETYFSHESASAFEFDRGFAIDAPAAAGAILAVGSATFVAATFGAAGFGGSGFGGGPVYASEGQAAQTVQPPNSLASFARRLQETAELPEPSVRIERFDRNVVVYLPGTQVWSVPAGKNPLDLTSNLQAMANPSGADSQRAVSQALKAAAVGPGDSVLFVGHSQGGMIAANLASRPQPYRVAAIITMGAPIGQVAGQIRAPVLAIEHRGDLVPKLDQTPNPVSRNVVTVQLEGPADNPVKNHELGGYRESAAELDKSRQVELQKIRANLTGFAGNKAGRARWFNLARFRAGADPG